MLQSSKVEWIEESRLNKTWTTRAKDNGWEAEQRGDPRAKGKRERERDGEAEQGSAVTTKASGSASTTMLVLRHLLISHIRKHQCTREVKVPAAVLGVPGCREPPQDQRLGFCLALWLLSTVRRIAASCRAFSHKNKRSERRELVG